MLTLKNVSKTYGKKKALSDFSYTFDHGIYALLGPNGAGKSTLMNIIAGVTKANVGSDVLLDGHTQKELKDLYFSAIGYMPQQQSLIESFTPVQFLGYVAGLKGIDKKTAESEMETLLKSVELWEVRHKKCGGFSGGMKQRLLFAQALLGKPKILILDEPTAGLDPRQRVILRRMIEQYAKENTVIISTHIVSDVEMSADKIIFIKQGKILEQVDRNDIDEGLENRYMTLFGEENYDTDNTL